MQLDMHTGAAHAQQQRWRQQRRTVANGAHAVLTHAKAHITLRIAALLEVAKHLHEGEVGAREVGAAAPEAGHRGRNRVEHGL